MLQVSPIAFFCRHPLERREIDPDWAAEGAAARRAGFEVVLVDHDELVAGVAPTIATRSSPTPAIYRGWMLRAEAYAAFESALRPRGIALVHDGAAYRTAHHLPGWYPHLAGRTPRSVWTEAVDAESVTRALADLGARSAIVKDWVKSAKHAWREATFIPDTADREAALSVVRRFLDIQGEDLAGGVVLREWLALEPIPGTARALEHRYILLDGTVLAAGPHPDVPESGEPPHPAPFVELARRIPARFLAVDVARTTSGEHVVIEVGDAQVSTLPAGTDLGGFHQRLAGELA